MAKIENKTKTASNTVLARIRSKWNHHVSLVGMQNGICSLENGLAVSYKTKHTTTIQLPNLTPAYFTPEK